MGVKKNVGLQEFPKQGKMLGMSVLVCFNYDTEHTIKGVVVRDDIEEPNQGIIELEDGRFVRTVECQYTSAVAAKR